MRCEIPRRSQTDFFNLSNALLSLAMRLETSASILAERESVLPRCVKFSMAWSLCPFTVILGSWYWFSGAGWYITSVFLVPMVRPKFSQAVENPSKHFLLIVGIQRRTNEYYLRRFSVLRVFDVNVAELNLIPIFTAGLKYRSLFYQYRKYPKHSKKLTLGLVRPKQKFLGLKLAFMNV